MNRRYFLNQIIVSTMKKQHYWFTKIDLLNGELLKNPFLPPHEKSMPLLPSSNQYFLELLASAKGKKEKEPTVICRWKMTVNRLPPSPLPQRNPQRKGILWGALIQSQHVQKSIFRHQQQTRNENLKVIFYSFIKKKTIKYLGISLL